MNSAWVSACETGNLGALQIYVTARNVNVCVPVHGTPLHAAVRHNRRKCAVWLIECAGANVNAIDLEGGHTPLRVACNAHGRLWFIPLLLDAGARVGTAMATLCVRRTQMRYEGNVPSIKEYDTAARAMLRAGGAAALACVSSHKVPWWAPNYVARREQCRRVAVVLMWVAMKRYAVGDKVARLLGRAAWAARGEWE